MKPLISFILGSVVGTIILATLLHLNYQLPQPVASLPDGAIYDGDMADGILHGTGRMRWPNGDTYYGEFRNGQFHGMGRFERANGFVYEGEFTKGDFTGTGTMHWSEDRYYTGEIKAGRLHGKGVLVNEDTHYEGEFADDKYHGIGTLSLPNGDEYSGEFVRGLFQGEGVYITADKRRYEGEFSGNTFTGQGKFSDEGGRHYEGGFKDWLFHGEGRLTEEDGDQYIGAFDKGRLNGKGEFIGTDGEHYIGDFHYGVYDGRGKLTTEKGDVYQGRFRYGKYHGRGTLTYAEPVDGVSIVKGRWKSGRLVEASNKALIIDPPANNEQALYNQEALLEASWRKLENNDPNAIEMFFLGVAGDGTESVFRREVLYVKDYFDRHLGTDGHSIILINNGKTVSKYPLATRASIRRALAKISDRMDPANDILFLYLSSHGSSDFEFILKQEDLSLPDLPAGELAAMLNELPVRWKVIVISACYSGGFIPVLKDDHTLIITAADSENTSFGCNDRNDFTYFGEAYFKDALPEADDFIEAFDNAKAIIHEREEAEEYGHSNPQIHKPRAILEHLQAWRAGVQIANGEDHTLASE